MMRGASKDFVQIKRLNPQALSDFSFLLILVLYRLV